MLILIDYVLISKEINLSKILMIKWILLFLRYLIQIKSP